MDLLCSHCAFTTHYWRLWYSVPPIFFLDCTQYTHAQPSFSAMAGSAGYGSGFPWDSIPFTLSLQLLPTVLPMCLEDQDKHSHDEWLTEKEWERLWTYFSTTSPGRMTPEIPTACRTRDNPSRISSWLPKMGLSQPEMPRADHRSSFGVDTQCATCLLLGQWEPRVLTPVPRTATSPECWLGSLCQPYHFSKSSAILWLFLFF